MSRPVLYIGSKRYSSWSLRAWLALEVLGIGFDEKLIPLGASSTDNAIRAVSPSGRVPVLLHDGEAVWESIAIMEYIAETFPDAGVWPTDAKDRALARSVSAEMHAGFGALRSACPMDFGRTAESFLPPPDAMVDLARFEGIVEHCRLRTDGTGPYLFGNFTAADAMFAPLLVRIERYILPASAGTAAYMDAIFRLGAFQRWAASASLEPEILD